jgi:zinc transport system ATP-binding protein
MTKADTDRGEGTALRTHKPGTCCTRLTDLGVTLNENPILEHINLHIHCRELTAIIGPNGAGKSTLFKAILGEVPHSGEIHFLRGGGPSPEGTPQIGYVPQRLDFDVSAPITVLDLFAGATARWPLCLGRTRRTRRVAGGALEQVGAENLLEDRIGRLSGGQLQKVLLALALTPLPNLLLLDEPVSGVDQAGLHLFYHMVADLRQRFDLAILLISHDLNVAAHVADRMVFLNRRILCDGAPQAVLADPAVMHTFAMDINLPDGSPPPSPGAPVPCRVDVPDPEVQP